MIIQCQSCSRKFTVSDLDIPKEGRMVQCGYCSVSWHQMPVAVQSKTPELEQTSIKEPAEKISEGLSVEKIKASDGKTYKFLGTQWAQLLPSGKTGLFAKRKIGKELDKLTGRESTVKKRPKKIRELEINTIEKMINPASGSLDSEEKAKNISEPKQGIGFFGYIFLLIIIVVSIVGVLKTFENDLLNYFPEIEYIFELLNQQLEFFAETIKNMNVIINDLINSY